MNFENFQEIKSNILSKNLENQMFDIKKNYNGDICFSKDFNEKINSKPEYKFIFYSSDNEKKGKVFNSLSDVINEANNIKKNNINYVLTCKILENEKTHEIWMCPIVTSA
jgi:hypothetical protein